MCLGCGRERSKGASPAVQSSKCLLTATKVHESLLLGRVQIPATAFTGASSFMRVDSNTLTLSAEEGTMRPTS